MALSPPAAPATPATPCPHGVPCAYVGLGANLGDAAQTLRRAAMALQQHPDIQALQLSPLYATAPVDSSGPDYVNAVARLCTTLAPHALLAVLQQIEQAHGRTRPWRNAPRTLDLDLLWYDHQTIESATLTVPHPRMHVRAFVLRPLHDLDPHLRLPQGTVATLLAHCTDQVIRPLPTPPSPHTMTTHHTPWIRLVVAYDQNLAIGHQGGMPWHLPGDLAHFKRSTLGHPIIMGRKTWLSIGRALPGRRNLVLSRAADFSADGAECFASLDQALAQCAHESAVSIIGGAEVFRQALPLAHEIIATEIQATFPADTWFPPLPAGLWHETERQPQPPENNVRYDFVIYRRLAQNKALSSHS